jgi:hypothetical protein
MFLEGESVYLRMNEKVGKSFSSVIDGGFWVLPLTVGTGRDLAL